MDGVDPDLMINVTCLQKPPLSPLVPDLVLVGGPLRLWVPLFPTHGPFRVMAVTSLPPSNDSGTPPDAGSYEAFTCLELPGSISS